MIRYSPPCPQPHWDASVLGTAFWGSNGFAFCQPFFWDDMTERLIWDTFPKTWLMI